MPGHAASMHHAPNHAPAPERGPLWADTVVIVTSLLLFGLAVWGPPALADTGFAREVPYINELWAFYAVAGSLALLGVAIGQRWRHRRLARIATIAAGLVLAAGLLMFRDLGWRAWVTMIIPALLLLASAPFVGPMSIHPSARE